MQKKEYVAPDCQVVLLKIHNTLLAGSPQNVIIEDDLNDGYGD